MPTAVLQLDADALPPSVHVDPRYDRAFALIRWHGHPVAHCTFPVVDGTVDGGVLRDGIAAAASDAIAERRVAEFLDWDGRVATTSQPATIAICTRDRLDDLERCLSAIAALPDDAQEVLVVDSASRDGDGVRAVVDRHPGVRYVRESRPGLDIARNRALREARGEFVCFCDDDAEVDAGWLRALAANFGDPRTLCVTGLVLPRELETPAQECFERTNSFSRGYRRVEHDGVDHDPFFVSRVGAGASMALRRSALAIVGPFDEALDAGTPSRSGGDHDYFTRVMCAGYRIIYEPAALSWHRHRREWHALRDAVEGYGTGVWAYLTRQVLHGEYRALMVVLGWLPWQVHGAVRSMLGRPNALPLELAAAELRGCFAGPRAYWRARRALRRAGAST